MATGRSLWLGILHASVQHENLLYTATAPTNYYVLYKARLGNTHKKSRKEGKFRRQGKPHKFSFKIAKTSEQIMSFSFMHCLYFREHLHIRYVREMNTDVKLYLLLLLFNKNLKIKTHSMLNLHAILSFL